MKKIISMFAVSASLLVGAAAHAAWPEKPINFIIPYGAGGATDMQARFLADKLAQKLGQPVIAVNRPGAGTTIATTQAAATAPDGYNLLMGSITSHGIAPFLYAETLRYDPVADFDPVALVTSIPNVLLINPKLPVNTIDELVAYARKKEGGLNYASAGYGSSTHMAAVLLEDQLGIKMEHIPYTSGGQAIMAVMSGDVDIYFDQISTAMPHIKSKRVKALAVTAPRPAEIAPEIKPIRIASDDPALKGFDMAAWWGVFVKNGTDPAIVATLNKAFNEILTENRDFFLENGITTEGGQPADLKDLVDKELVRWEAVVKTHNLKPN